MKLYCLVRSDLAWSQKAVQAGHAIAQLCLLGPLGGWDNGTLVLYRVSPEELAEFDERLEGRAQVFREPDLDNQMTALATVERMPEFDGLRLL